MTADPYCSFCDKSAREVLGLVARQNPPLSSESMPRICNECVTIAVDKLLRPVDAYKNAPINRRLAKAARNMLKSIDSGSPTGTRIDAGRLRNALSAYDEAT